MLRESEATRAVADRLRGAGVEVGWCRPADGILGRIGKRIGRMRRRADRKGYETWYHEIGRLRPDLVWFNLSHIGAVADLRYAAALCRRRGHPVLAHPPARPRPLLPGRRGRARPVRADRRRHRPRRLRLRPQPPGARAGRRAWRWGTS